MKKDVKERFKQLESEGRVKVNWTTGEFELLGSPEQQQKTLNKFMYINPQVCLQMMQQLMGDTNEKDNTNNH